MLVAWMDPQCVITSNCITIKVLLEDVKGGN